MGARSIRVSAVLLAALACSAAMAQKYTGQRPAKPDLPYLLHAANLVETDSGTAQESKVKDNLLYVVPGPSATARTPLAEPIFIIDSQKLNPDRLALYRMEVKNGQRQLQIPAGGKAGRGSTRPVFLMVTKLEGSLFRVEVNEYLENGEYCLSPDGSNQVFCFTAY